MWIWVISWPTQSYLLWFFYKNHAITHIHQSHLDTYNLFSLPILSNLIDLVCLFKWKMSHLSNSTYHLFIPTPMCTFVLNGECCHTIPNVVWVELKWRTCSSYEINLSTLSLMIQYHSYLSHISSLFNYLNGKWVVWVIQHINSSSPNPCVARTIFLSVVTLYLMGFQMHYLRPMWFDSYEPFQIISMLV